MPGLFPLALSNKLFPPFVIKQKTALWPKAQFFCRFVKAFLTAAFCQAGLSISAQSQALQSPGRARENGVYGRPPGGHRHQADRGTHRIRVPECPGTGKTFVPSRSAKVRRALCFPVRVA
jgi:hypothetical protein